MDGKSSLSREHAWRMDWYSTSDYSVPATPPLTSCGGRLEPVREHTLSTSFWLLVMVSWLHLQLTAPLTFVLCCIQQMSCQERLIMLWMMMNCAINLFTACCACSSNTRMSWWVVVNLEQLMWSLESHDKLSQYSLCVKLFTILGIMITINTINTVIDFEFSLASLHYLHSVVQICVVWVYKGYGAAALSMLQGSQQRLQKVFIMFPVFKVS